MSILSSESLDVLAKSCAVGSALEHASEFSDRGTDRQTAGLQVVGGSSVHCANCCYFLSLIDVS